jgi:hypothetical protein|tara:strand:+ start:324 stop:512 length:189 start_codon:yes stop_codon:yes gene_type:complete
MFVGEIEPTLDVTDTPVGLITDCKTKVGAPTAEVEDIPVSGTKFSMVADKDPTLDVELTPAG